MKYDFLKVLGKSSASVHADWVLKKLLSQISDREDNGKDEELLFTLVNELDHIYYISIFGIGYVKLKSVVYSDALIVFLEVKRLLQEDGYKIIDISEESFAITF